jgi:hypothetical protein
MENDKKVVPICVKCNYQSDGYTGYYCLHPDADFTNFLDGLKECSVLNSVGQCKLYRLPQAKEATKTTACSITVDLTLNTEPFKKKMAELLAGL